MAEAKNVLGEPLEICCTAPLTGFYRTGTCETGPQDVGTCRFYWEYPHPGWLLAFTALGPLTFRELATSFHRAGEVCPGLNPPEIPAQNFAPGPAWGDFLRQDGIGDISYRDELWLEGYPDFGLFCGLCEAWGPPQLSRPFCPGGSWLRPWPIMNAASVITAHPGNL